MVNSRRGSRQGTPQPTRKTRNNQNNYNNNNRPEQRLSNLRGKGPNFDAPPLRVISAGCHSTHFLTRLLVGTFLWQWSSPNGPGAVSGPPISREPRYRAWSTIIVNFCRK